MREPFKVSWIAVFFAIFRENNNLTKSSKSPASIAKSNKQGGDLLVSGGGKPLLISCVATIWL